MCGSTLLDVGQCMKGLMVACREHKRVCVSWGVCAWRFELCDSSLSSLDESQSLPCCVCNATQELQVQGPLHNSCCFTLMICMRTHDCTGAG